MMSGIVSAPRHHSPRDPEDKPLDSRPASQVPGSIRPAQFPLHGPPSPG